MIASKSKRMKKVYLFVAIIVLVAVGIGYILKRNNTPCAQFRKLHPEYASLHIFTSQELSSYDGVKDDKTYIGFHCIVYDVTAGKDQFYAEGKGYHYLVGRDATKQLEIFGGDIIESKYPKVGLLAE